MTAYIGFYKGGNTFIDKAIKWFTNSKYSHVEIVIGDYRYSISPDENELIQRPNYLIKDDYDFIEVSIDSIRASKLYAQFRGARYDYLGVFGVALWRLLPHTRVEMSHRLFCSEWGAMLLGLDNAYRYSPEALFQYITKGVTR